MHGKILPRGNADLADLEYGITTRILPSRNAELADLATRQDPRCDCV